MTAAIYKALGANGKLYKLHTGKGNRGYVYALGHRVYGTVAPVAVWHTDTMQYVFPFTAVGKWAFILAPNTASVQPETAGV